MYEVQYKKGNLVASYIGKNLLIVNRLTKRYFVEKKVFLAKYLVDKLFIDETLSCGLVLDEYVNKIFRYLESDIRICGDEYIIYFEITDKCNLRCIHCYNNSNAQMRMTNKEIPVEMLEEVIKRNRDKKNLKVILSGGEPILHSQFEKIVEMLDRYEVKTTVYTNGIDSTRFVNVFLKYGVNVMISLDGANGKDHDYIRGKGSFERTCLNIKRLCDEIDLDKVTFSFTINRYNFTTIEEMLLLCREFRVKRVYFNPVASLGRNREDFLGLNYEELVYMWNVLYDLEKKYSDIRIICDTYWKARYIEKNLSLPFDCSICKKIRVSVNGDVYPCTFFDDENILKQNINNDNILFVGSQYEKVKENLNKRLLLCDECVFMPLCNGGCPAAGYRDANWGISEVECLAKRKFFYECIEKLI